MKHRTIDPVAIKELICLDFHIPSYQRGYRWTTQQIKELLEDIECFCEKGAKGIYCIQPLVVKGHGAYWDVIDGQQRLTTINIILSCLNQETTISNTPQKPNISQLHSQSHRRGSEREYRLLPHDQGSKFYSTLETR